MTDMNAETNRKLLRTLDELNRNMPCHAGRETSLLVEERSRLQESRWDREGLRKMKYIQSKRPVMYKEETGLRL